MNDVKDMVDANRIRREDTTWEINISRGDRRHALDWVLVEAGPSAALDQMLAAGEIGLDPYGIAWVRP